MKPTLQRARGFYSPVFIENNNLSSKQLKFAQEEVELSSQTDYHLDSDTYSPLVSIDEYRELFNDRFSTDEHITERLRYLQALCRNMIVNELKQNV